MHPNTRPPGFNDQTTTLGGILHGPGAPMHFSALVHIDEATPRSPQTLRGAIVFWRGADRTRITLSDPAYDPEAGILTFTVYTDEQTRRFVLHHVGNTSWIGTCHLEDDPKPYPVGMQTVHLPTPWFDPEQLNAFIRTQEERRERQATLTAAQQERAASEVIRGAYPAGQTPFTPRDAPDNLGSSFGVRELEASARRVIAFCRQRPSDHDGGSWEPFSLAAFDAFCRQMGEKPTSMGTWLEGLVKPHEDAFVGPRGGGYLAMLDADTVGVTQAFVNALIRQRQRTL